MKRIIKKSFKYAGITIGSLLILMIITTLVINFFFKDQIIRYVLGQLENQTNAKISIGKIDFSIWRQFPNASIMFDNIYAQSSNQFKAQQNSANEKDTLLVADRIFLELNMLKLIKGDYQLKRLNIQNGTLKLLIDSKGNANYDILKKSEKPSEKEFNLELNDLLFTNTVLVYDNLKSGVKFRGTASRLNIKGNFKAQTYDLQIQSDLFANYLIINDNSYLIRKPLELDFNLLVDNKHYQIKDAQFKINKLQFFAVGDFTIGDESHVDLFVTGHKLDLSQIMEALPDRFRAHLTDYSGKGQTALTLTVKGKVGKRSNPKVDLKVSLKNGVITQNIANIKLHNINLQATFNNGLSRNSLTSVIKVDKCTANLGSGIISGSITMENLNQPEFSLIFNSKLELKELKEFFKIQTLEKLAGSVESNISATAKFDKFYNLQTTDVKNVKCNGQIKLTDASVKIEKSDYFFEQINGNVTLKNDIFFNNISVMVQGNDFLINGSLTDGLEYFLKQRNDVTLNAEVISRNLDLSKYFVTNPTTATTTRKSARELLFPEHINLDIKVSANNFKLNKFNAKWASGYITYKPKMFVLKSISLETLTGHLSGNGAVLQDMNKNFIVKGQVDISRVDIQQMFYTFNNFSQVVIEDRHLRGKVSGKVNLSTEWNNAFVANLDKIIIESDLTINNGELVNYEPLQSLSDYISVEELKNIKFSTLKNHIYVKDRQVIIPQMDVASTAFTISASGIHNFDNHYSYKVKVLLSELMWGKAKKAKKQNEEFGIVEDDGLGKTSIPLSITGFKNDYKISYDTKQTLGIVKKGLENQKQELKTVFNKEFGWFKKDSTLKKTQLQKKNDIKVVWDEDAPQQESQAQTQEDPPQQKPVEKKPKKTSNKDKKPADDKVKVEFE